MIPGMTDLFGAAAVRRAFNRGWSDRAFWKHGRLPRLGSLGRILKTDEISRDIAAYRHGLMAHMSQRGRSYEKMEVLPREALRMWRKGRTIQLHELQEAFPAVRTWVDRVSASLGVPPRAPFMACSAFLSPPGKALPFHFDEVDVLIVQLSGRKLWRIAPNGTVPFPTAMHAADWDIMNNEKLRVYCRQSPAPVPETIESVSMAPGSALFLPRGYWHETTTEEDSVSISLVFNAPTALDLFLDRLRYSLIQHPAWRRPAGGGWGRRARAEAQKRLAVLLRRWKADAGSLDAAEILACHGSRRITLATRSRPWENAVRFQRAPKVRAMLEKSRQNESVALVIAARGTRTEVELSSEQAIFCQKILRRSKIGQSELTAGLGSLDREDALQLMEILVCAGAFVPG